MDGETKRLLCNDLTRINRLSQAASIAGCDQSADRLLKLAWHIRKCLGAK